MKTLRVGIASYNEMKAMTLAVARGQRKLTQRDPRIWFLPRSRLPGCFRPAIAICFV